MLSMKKNWIVLSFIAVFMQCAIVLAQPSVCGGFHRKYCKLEGSKEDAREFMYNAQSKSGLFAQGTTSKMRCVIYKGMDYRMTVCAETEGSGGVNFKIFDAKTNEELFDNTKNDNTQQFEFSSASTRQLIIEVSVPSGETSGSGKPMDAACVGLLIEHKVADRIGFSQY